MAGTSVKCPAVDRRSEGRRRFDINDGATRVEGGRFRIQAAISRLRSKEGVYERRTL